MTTSQESGSTLSFVDAADEVLQQSNGQKPLHYKTITERAITQGLVRTRGRTPPHTMYAQITREIRKKEHRGIPQRFTNPSPGTFGLVRWSSVGIAATIEDNNRKVQEDLLDRVRAESPEDFETLIEELLTEMGFEDVTVTARANDGGIDVRGTLVVGKVVRIRMAVQAKRWSRNVQAPTVQQVRGALGTREQGLIITTSDFSKGARDEAARPNAAPVALMNGKQLAELLGEYEIGAQAQNYSFLTLDSTD